MSPKRNCSISWMLVNSHQGLHRRPLLVLLQSEQTYLESGHKEQVATIKRGSLTWRLLTLWGWVRWVTGWVHANRSSSLLCRWPQHNCVRLVRHKETTSTDKLPWPARLQLQTRFSSLKPDLCPIVPLCYFILINPGAGEGFSFTVAAQALVSLSWGSALCGYKRIYPQNNRKFGQIFWTQKAGVRS